MCTLTQAPPELVERISLFLVQVDVVPQELDIHLFTVLWQRRQGQLIDAQKKMNEKHKQSRQRDNDKQDDRFLTCTPLLQCSEVRMRPGR